MDPGQALLDGVSAALGPQAAVYALAAVGLNVHLGHTGLLNLGQAGFMLLGGYGLAITVVVFAGPWWLGVVIGLACALALAVAVGVPTLRRPAIYLAIVTLAAAEIVRQLFGSVTARPFTGGARGLQGFAEPFYARNPIPAGSYRLGFVDVGAHHRVWVLLVAWGVVLLACLFVWWLLRSPLGRALHAVRYDAAAAESLGKNTFALRLQGLALGAALGAAAGMLLAVDEGAVHPATFLPTVTLLAYAALIIGGVGRSLGPVIGAMILWFALAVVEVTFEQLGAAGHIDLAWLPDGALRPALAGVITAVALAFRPHGLLGDPRTL